jgi:hypothetical protein
VLQAQVPKAHIISYQDDSPSNSSYAAWEIPMRNQGINPLEGDLQVPIEHNPWKQYPKGYWKLVFWNGYYWWKWEQD